jgi:hypothetical protein
MLTHTSTAVKKVVDRKPGAMLGSFESHGLTLLFYSIGVGEDEYACPSKKEKERKHK